MQKVLITGGTGFLGSHITKRIIDSAESITIVTTSIRQQTTLKALGVDIDKINLVKGDVRDFDFIRLLFNEYEFDTVFHLGALSEVKKCQPDPKLAFDINVGGTVNILEACRMYGKVKAVVVSSSDKAYGSGEGPYVEGQSLNGERPMIWKGSEKSTREFLYIDDAVNAYLSLVENIDKTKGEAYNIGSGEIFTIEELLNGLLDTMKSDLDIEYVEKDFPEISHQYLDSSKIKRHTEWTPETSLLVGLVKSIESYKEIL